MNPALVGGFKFPFLTACRIRLATRSFARRRDSLVRRTRCAITPTASAWEIEAFGLSLDASTGSATRLGFRFTAYPACAARNGTTLSLAARPSK